MDFDRLASMDPLVLYRKYLFQNGNFQEWIGVWVGSFNHFVLRRMKRYCVVLAALVNLFAYTVAADGTGHGLMVSKFVHLINKDLDVYERAYQDIEKLAVAIGTSSGVVKSDERFVLAFLITKWSREFGFDPLEVAAVALTESQFNPRAVSPKDARGLMQIHRPTWHMDNYFNTEANIKKGTQILYMYRNSQPDSYLKLYYGDRGEDGSRYVNKVNGNYKRLARIYREARRVQ